LHLIISVLYFLFPLFLVNANSINMKRSLIAIFITVFFLAFGMSFVSPVLPLLLKKIGASSASIGQIQTSYFLSFTLTTLLLGRLIDKIGSKILIISGLFIFGLGFLVMPLLNGPSLFYLIRTIQGIGTALLFAPTEAAINIISPPEKRATNMGIYGVVFAVGFAIGPIIGTSLYAIDFQMPFFFGSSCCLAAIMVLLFGYDNVPVPVKKSEFGFSQMIGLLIIPLAAAACYAIVEVSIGTFLSLYLSDLGIWSKKIGIVFTVFAVGGIVSPYPAGKLADTLGKVNVLKGCAFLLLITTLSFNFFDSYFSICVLCFMVGLVAGALYPIALAHIADIVPPDKMGRANASFSFFYGLGCIAGPLTTGWVIELFSIKSLFYPMTVSTLGLVIIMFFATSDKNKIQAVLKT
jgi:MFS family permease